MALKITVSAVKSAGREKIILTTFFACQNQFLVLEVGVKVFLDSCHWDEWKTHKNPFSLDKKKFN